MKKKNYYEMSGTDLEQYQNEFSVTRHGRALNELKLVCLIAFIVGFVVGNVLSLFADEGFDVVGTADLMNGVAAIAFVSYFPLIIYYQYCFKRWLKIKYNIEY